MSTRPLTAQISAAGWRQRLHEDRARAQRNQTLDQRATTMAVLARALQLGALAVTLTGSTARRRRTLVSDLDYHVIGRRPNVGDLPADIDIVATSAERFHEQLLDRDDFSQWTLRFGCILHDTGVLWSGVRLVVAEQLWPSGDRKLASLADHCRELRRLVAMSDRDAAQEQARAALTAAARGLLLSAGVFPLSRSELPGQLDKIGCCDVAAVLTLTLHGTPELTELGEATGMLEAIAPTRPLAEGQHAALAGMTQPRG